MEALVDITTGHASRGELASALERGAFHPARRRRVLAHLAACCPVCEAALEAWVSREDATSASGDDLDPLVRGLRDWRRAWCSPATLAADFPPSYAAALGRLLEAVLCQALFRVFVEASRQVAVERPREAVKLSREIAGELEGCLAPVDDAWARNAIALAHAYHAEALYLSKDSGAAEICMGRAREWAGDDKEVRATLYEIQADVLQARNMHRPALQMLRTAAGLLLGAQPARRLENRLREGIALLRCKRYEESAGVLRVACNEAVENVYPPLRLEVFHRFAAVELQNGRYASVLATVKQAEDLYESVGSELKLIQRAWLTGAALLYSGKVKESEVPLRQALEGYFRLKIWGSAMNALVALGECYLRLRRRKDFLDLMKEQAASVPMEAVTRFVEVKWELLQLAKVNDMDDDELFSELRELETGDLCREN